MANITNEEIAKFEKMAAEWWDENGKFKPLHQMNPVRIEFIRNLAIEHFNIKEQGNLVLKGLDILDVGCGGGLISVPMHKLGANVKAIDASDINVEIAKAHAKSKGLDINY